MHMADQWVFPMFGTLNMRQPDITGATLDSIYVLHQPQYDVSTRMFLGVVRYFPC